MQIDRRTLIYSAVQQVHCSKEQALAFYSRMTEINFDRLAAEKCPHSVEQCAWGSDGLLIAGKDFHAANLADDICMAIAELLVAASIDYLDVTYCVCTPVFHLGSHWGGNARIHRDGRVSQTKFLGSHLQ